MSFHFICLQRQARRFAKRCFTPLELYSFQNVFQSLADHQDSIAYLKEDTLARFLEVPDILGVSPILFQMVSSLGAFPFGQDAPVVLGFEQMIMVREMLFFDHGGCNDRLLL